MLPLSAGSSFGHLRLLFSGHARVTQNRAKGAFGHLLEHSPCHGNDRSTYMTQICVRPASALQLSANLLSFNALHCLQPTANMPSCLTDCRESPRSLAPSRAPDKQGSTKSTVQGREQVALAIVKTNCDLQHIVSPASYPFCHGCVILIH
jgi:hypothetical protein